MKIVFLVSSGGGNLKFLLCAIRTGIISETELFVIADRECRALQFAKESMLAYSQIRYHKNDNAQLLKALRDIEPDLIITTWHKILDAETVQVYRGKLINLHYSLLPAFAGMIGSTPIEKGVAAGCKYLGVTCHHVDESVDGGAIIAQAIVKNEGDLESLTQQLFKKGCLILLNSIILLSEQPHAQHDRFDFEPSLTFDPQIFDRPFWQSVAIL